jgi:predicted LPLAT superfamily acyltransferase
MAAMNLSRAHWAGLNEFSFVAGMRLLFWIARWFGRWPFRIVLYPVLLWYVLAKAQPRRASLAYLQRAKRFTSVRADMLGVFTHFGHFAETMLDKMLLWGGAFDFTRVQSFGIELLDRQIRSKQGFVMVCSHLGNLELCRLLSSVRDDIKLTVLVHTKHARAFNQMLETINPKSQLNLLQVTDMNAATAMMLAEKVGKGEFVVIAGDRVPVSEHPRVAVVDDFLGEAAAFPIGPFLMGGVLQCPLYMMFSLKRDQHYEVHFELLRESFRLPRVGREQALKEVIADYAARLQYHCLRAPYQWFNFYDFWHLPQPDTPDASR